MFSGNFKGSSSSNISVGLYIISLTELNMTVFVNLVRDKDIYMY